MATFAGTSSDDIIIPTAPGVDYRGGAGGDTYILTNLIPANATISIIDTEGANKIQLADGLSIASSIVLANATQLTLSNGAKISIQGASSFTYDIGANATSGDTAVTPNATYAQFAAALGVATLPTGTAQSTGTAYTVSSSTSTTPTFSVAAGATSVTEGGNATFTVTLSAAQGTATTVNYALAGTGGAVLGTDTGTAVVAGTNVTSTATTLTFAPGATTATITVPVTFDANTETGEGASLTLTSPSTGASLGANAVAVTAFADPAAPTFTLTSNAVAGAANEEGTTITYTVTPSGITDKAYTFTLSTIGDTVGGVATAGAAADFSPASQTVTFAAGTSTAQTVTQTIVNDGTSEGLEGYKTSLLDSTFTVVSSKTGLITDPTSGTLSGTTYTLTTDGNTVPGTTGNDTINGTIDDNTAANNTFTILDVINGDSGTDTLSITADASGAAIAFPAATVTNVEKFSFRNVSAQTLTVDTSLFSGETHLISDRSTAQVDFTNVASGTQVTVAGNTSVTNGATNATYVAGATAGVLNLENGTTAGAIAINGAGFTSLAINSTGATNVTGAVSSSGTSIAATTINATTAFETTGLTVGTVAAGGQTLVISGSAGEVAATATSAAKSAVTLGALDADYVSINASGLTAGGVSATLSATTTATFTGGVGNDRITTSTSAQTGAVNAGLGTDTLILAASAHIDTTAEGTLYAGFEKLEALDNTAIDMDLITGSTITAIAVNDAGSATSITNMTATQAANVTVLAGTGAMTLGIKDATQVATNNTLTITVSDGDTTGSEALAGTGDWTIAGVETINITATDDLTLATMANITGLTSLVATGAGDVSITTGAHVVTANESVNFSGLTAASTFNFAAATTNALGFTGGSGIDTVTDSVTGGNVISTGAGRDVVTLTAKTGGTSADVITLGAGGDSLVTTAAKGNDAQDLLTLKFASTDSVIDGSITATGFTAATMDAITGIDFATVAAAATGHVITFDTDKSATAVTFAGTVPSFTAASVTNAFDFYVFNTGAGGITYVYQDTDGDKIIENGEFGIQLTGVAATASTTGEFAIGTGANLGNLILTTVAG